MQAKSHILPRPVPTQTASQTPLTVEEFEALYSRAMDFLRQGLALRAARALAGLVQVQPDDARVYRGLGIACHHLQQYGVAYLAYGSALQLTPHDLCALALRAECSMFVLPAAQAQALLRHVAAQSPQSADEERAVRRAQVLVEHLGLPTATPGAA